MANAKQHMTYGAAATSIAWYIYCKVTDKKIELIDLVFAALAGAAAGLLPDLLEPASSPHHRQFFHSFAAAGLLAKGNHWVWQHPEISEQHKVRVSMISVAYFSHLLADASTPMGLPLIGRVDL